MTHRADIELARLAAEAAPWAFDAFFDDTIARVYAFVQRRSSSAEAAQRVTERVLTHVFRELPDYDGSVPLSVWVLAILKRELRGEHRASQARPRSLAIPPPPASGG